MLVEVVVSAKALVARRVRAEERLLVGVDRANMALEMFAALETLATARHLARVNFATLAEIVHLLGLVGNTTAAGALGDEAGIWVGKVSKVAVEAHALGQQGQAGSLGRHVLDLNLARRGRGEHRGKSARHTKARIGR